MMKFEFTKDQIERLLETYNVKDIDKLLNEDIGTSIIGRILGRNVVAKLEANYSDDAVKVLDNLFAAVEAGSGNIVKGADKKLYLVSANGKKWDMNVIKKTIEGVASGKLPESALEMLPKTLKDRQSFRQIFQNQFKYGKKIGPAVPKPKATVKPKATSDPINPFETVNPYDALKPIQIPKESKDAFIKIMNEKGFKIKPEHLDKVMLEVQKSIDSQLAKLEQTFMDPTFIKTLQSYNRLPLPDQELIIKKAIQSVKSAYGEYLLGLRVTEKTRQNLQSAYEKSVDTFFLGHKNKGEWIKWGDFFKWYKKSVGISLSLFAYSIYVEAVRNEDKGFWKNLEFAGNKFIEAPERLFKSLIPGANLIFSSSSAILQTFLFLAEYISKKLNNSKPKTTLLQKAEKAVKQGAQFADSTFKVNKPKVDSIGNIYQPKVDSVIQKLKTDYKDQSTNAEPLNNKIKIDY